MTKKLGQDYDLTGHPGDLALFLRDPEAAKRAGVLPAKPPPLQIPLRHADRGER
jgi:hypothetical protein